MDTKPRSRRILILWSVALGVLILTAVFCWAVVVPFLHVRAAVERCSRNPNVAPEEVERLGGPERAVCSLSRYARLPDWVANRKIAAAYILAHCGRPAVPTLVALLGNKREDVREHAAGRLGWMGAEAKEAVPALVEAVGDKNERVSGFARSALDSIGPAPRQAVPKLVRALGDTDRRVRIHAATALARMGAEANEAIPALEEASKDKDKGVRWYAAWALTNIRVAEGQEKGRR